MTDVCDRMLCRGGPAILLDKSSDHRLPILGRLFGIAARVDVIWNQLGLD